MPGSFDGPAVRGIGEEVEYNNSLFPFHLRSIFRPGRGLSLLADIIARGVSLFNHQFSRRFVRTGFLHTRPGPTFGEMADSKSLLGQILRQSAVAVSGGCKAFVRLIARCWLTASCEPTCHFAVFPHTVVWFQRFDKSELDAPSRRCLVLFSAIRRPCVGS
jgi:hypothetical protein